MRLFIKNMVCRRCIMAVEGILASMELEPVHVALGEVELKGELNAGRKTELAGRLAEYGFALIDDRKSRVISRIKSEIISLVHFHDNELRHNLSEHLGRTLHTEYASLSRLFSEVEGTTIEQYYLSQKIERVKELLVYDELSLSEIADKLHYSSAAHLSSQFKKLTGLTPSHFRKISVQKRKALDEL